MIYAIICIVLAVVVGIGGAFTMAAQCVPAGQMDEFWRLGLPNPVIAAGELALGLLVRGYCGFFLPGDCFRWSLAGVEA